MTLTFQDLGALGELLGSMAVLATLVYLSLQTRQNNAAISAQLDVARLDADQQLALAQATSDGLLEALNGDRVEPVTIEQARLHHVWTVRFYQIQWNLRQLRQGLGVPTGAEEWMASRLRHYFNDFRSVEGWWNTNKHGFLPEFVDWVDEHRRS
jgi:hypothetical protein